MFKVGDIITSSLGEPIKIEKYLASGGQGDVYIVNYKNEKKALKYYKNAGSDPQAFYKNLCANVKRGAPDKTFLWPEAVTNKDENGLFGYLMDLRPEGFYELSEFIIARDVKFPSFKAAVEACIHIVSAFRILHNNGYSYQDLNDGNFFINPKTAEVLICDNDNVAPNGVNTGVIGKPRYLAPEIVIGQGSVLPNTQTDLFSLSIILFILLCNNHPFEGARCVGLPCMTAENSERLYGKEALFIYDQEDNSNRPVKEIHNNVIKRWSYMPKYIKEAFIKAFSKESINCPSRRLRELDWLKVLTRFESDIVRCSCGNEIFIKDAKDTVCDCCGKKYHVLNTFKLPEYSITVARGTKIYRCQLGVCDAAQALNPIIHILVKQQNGQIQMGWQNKTGKTIRAITSKGEDRKIENDGICPVKAGVVIYPDIDKKIEIL